MRRISEWFSALKDLCADVCQCDLTAKDLLKLLPCLFWTLVSAIIFTAYVSSPLIRSRWIPCFTVMLSLLNSIPSFMCGLLVIFFMRESVMRRGLDKSSIQAFKATMLFIWMFTVIASSIITISFLILAFKCDQDVAVSGGVAENVILLVCLVSWMGILIALHPKASYINYLLSKGEEHSRSRVTGSGIVVGSTPVGDTPVGSIPVSKTVGINEVHYKLRTASLSASDATWVSPHALPSSASASDGNNGVGVPQLIGQPTLVENDQRSNFEVENGSNPGF